MQTRRRNAERVEPGDLVDHQRDERRDHDGEAAVGDPRDPVGDALARARRRHEEHVGARLGRRDDVGLARPEVRESEGLLQDRASPRRGRERHQLADFSSLSAQEFMQ